MGMLVRFYILVISCKIVSKHVFSQFFEIFFEKFENLPYQTRNVHGKTCNRQYDSKGSKPSMQKGGLVRKIVIKD